MSNSTNSRVRGIWGIFPAAVALVSVIAFFVHFLGAEGKMKIAVIDYAKVIESIDPDATESQRGEVMDAVQTQIRKLGAAGYLVLDKNAVLFVPEEMKVPIPTLPEPTSASKVDQSSASPR